VGLYVDTDEKFVRRQQRGLFRMYLLTCIIIMFMVYGYK